MTTQTNPTPYTDINALLGELLASMRAILGSRLVGCYLYGSLVTGDFNPLCSDIDLLAAISTDLNEEERESLQTMHRDFAHNHKEWDNRIEVAYLSVNALKTFRTQVSQIAVISPGEPFHVKEAGHDWLVNWYIVREKGITLHGLPPEWVIDPIEKEEYLQVVREHTRMWREWIEQTYHRGAQAYAILTLCRALYTLTQREVPSKKRAALWAEQELPEWGTLIQQALQWRESREDDAQIDHAATLPETRRFVNYVSDLCEQIPGTPNV